MRITEEQSRIIKATIHRKLDGDPCIWRFGSRADDSRPGGDIDLHVETAHPELLRELRCKIDLEDRIDLHVDLIVARPGDELPIARIAKSKGIRL